MQLGPARVGKPENRFRLLFFTVMALVLLLVLRLIWVQGLWGGSELANEARSERHRHRVIQAARGDILDRSGQVLVSSSQLCDLAVNQLQIGQYLGPVDSKTKKRAPGDEGIAGAARKLAPLIGKSVEETTAMLTGKKGFSYLKKGMDAKECRAVMALRLPGVTADYRSIRIYPNGKVAGSLLGVVQADGKPAAGVELSLDKTLKGVDGTISYESGAQGQAIPSAARAVTPAQDGRDVQLTIDRDLQWYAQGVVSETARKFNAQAASAVIYNSRTGEILALADSGSYDPNRLTRKDNLAIPSVSYVFEPGSTGKLFTISGLLDTGKGKADDTYTVPWEKNFGRERIKDSHSHPVERLTLAGVLKESSNVGTVMAAERATPDERYKYLQLFGIGSKTGIELPGESPGILHPPSEWHGRTKLTTTFGQGYAVTPVQMVAAVGALTNGGVRVTPTIVKAIDDGRGLQPTPERERHRVVSEETAHQMLQMMDTNVPDKPGQNAYVARYAVGGKTGTAQTADHAYTASFIGVAPVDNPEIVVGVFVYGLKEFISGNTAAAPAFADIMRFTLDRQRIAPTGKPGTELPTTW
ncbi:peptidoglycan D,D-transpeptidase FtsI family protein [Dermabacteraceae bacterium P13101]